MKILKKCILLLLTLNYLFSCHTPEERATEAETKTKSPNKSHTVIIQQMKFTPAHFTVNEGDTVTWINRDMVDHNVTEEISKAWTSGNMRPGSSWKMVVLKSSAYFCTIHPVMKGSLSAR